MESVLFGVIRPALTALLFLCLGALAWAQDRGRMSVYVPRPTGGTEEQQTYFEDNFKMELTGANYPVAEKREDSLYSIVLNISDNPDYDRSAPADDYNKEHILGIKLERSADAAEIVNFSFPFSDLESMSSWNLFLLYQALANAYAPEEEAGPPPADDRWRSKRLYVLGSFGLDMGYYIRPGTLVTDQGYVLPTGLVGLEWHFLNFLSLEADLFKARFLHNKKDYLFTPSFAALIKGVFKPGSVMLEPYAGAEYSLALSEESIPWLSVLGGLQFGARGGARTVVTLDFNASYSLAGDMTLQNDSNPYQMIRFSLLAGLKVGFWDKTSKDKKDNKDNSKDKKDNSKDDKK